MVGEGGVLVLSSRQQFLFVTRQDGPHCGARWQKRIAQVCMESTLMLLIERRLQKINSLNSPRAASPIPYIKTSAPDIPCRLQQYDLSAVRSILLCDPFKAFGAKGPPLLHQALPKKRHK